MVRISDFQSEGTGSIPVGSALEQRTKEEDMARCEWCVNPNADDVNNPDTLCVDHAAEYEGITADSSQRRDAIQYAEYLDTL